MFKLWLSDKKGWLIVGRKLEGWNYGGNGKWKRKGATGIEGPHGRPRRVG